MKGDEREVSDALLIVAFYLLHAAKVLKLKQENPILLALFSGNI
jgi:hypothetical protein